MSLPVVVGIDWLLDVELKLPERLDLVDPEI